MFLYRFRNLYSRYIMGNRMILAALMLLFPAGSFAQEKRSFSQIDSLSYQAYLSSDWKKVLSYSSEGFKSGFDFYYLRMRAGIAELTLNRPVQASRHFREALKFSEYDQTAQSLLYSSLQFSGNLAEARILAADFSSDLREKLDIPERKLISSIFMEPGYMLNSKAAELKAFRPDLQEAHLYLVPAYWYVSAGVNIEAGKRFSATLATNILSFQATQQIIFQNQDPLVFDVPFDQRAVYFGAGYYLGKGFRISAAGHFLTCAIPLYSWSPGQAGGQYVQGASDWRDLAFNASLIKRFSYVTVGLSGDANRFKNVWYRQASASLTVYPSGNVNTYLKAEAAWLSDSLVSTGRLIAHGGIGRKLFRTVWIEGNYYVGNIQNYTEANAYVVYNNFDMIRKRFDINLMAYRILHRMDLSLRYQYTLRSATWLTYENSEYIEGVQQDYPVHSLIFGLIWQF